MSYLLEGYPHLVKVISTDSYGMAWVCDNLTGSCFRVEMKKLCEV